MRFISARPWLGLSVTIVSFIVLAGLVFGWAFHKPIVNLPDPPGSPDHDNTALLVSRIQGESKLVVATQSFTVDMDRADSWYLFSLLYLGQTVVRLRVDECKVQYYIHGAAVRAEDFRFDPSGHRLVATLPHPVLDEDFVDVPSDPNRWTVYKASGWARFDKDQVEEQARAALQTRVLEVARQKGWDRQVDLVAQERLRQLMQQFYRDPALVVEIGWR